jgi:hypothetical protein
MNTQEKDCMSRMNRTPPSPIFDIRCECEHHDEPLSKKKEEKGRKRTFKFRD